MSTIQEQADMIAHELLGTCESLHGILGRHELDGLDNNQEFCDIIDSKVFECTKCSWWFEISEMADDDDWQCEGCAEEDG